MNDEGRMPLKARLERISAELDEGKTPDTTVRELLRWFGAERRGYLVVKEIRRKLGRANLRTVPDFESVWIDAPVKFARPMVITAYAPTVTVTESVPETPEGVQMVLDDPTYRIGALPPANRPPVCVAPDDTLHHAITLMLFHDYSQLPVVSGKRDLKGMMSWSSIGQRLSLGQAVLTVRECMDTDVNEAPADRSLFGEIQGIVTYGYVIVRAVDKSLAGIVTNTDLSEQFLTLSEPFLLLGEIENHLRQLIDSAFKPAELVPARDPSEDKRTITGASDLNFGEYVRLLQSPEQWSRLGLGVDRAAFVSVMDDVRRIRNDVMHFHPDGTSPADLEHLRNFLRLVRRVRSFTRDPRA